VNESILKYSILGKALERVLGLNGFEKLEPRLKLKAEFYSAAFEAEIASSYVLRGWEVEFVEEGNNRSPDLKVTREDGPFFAECKCRDVLTERDRMITLFWVELESGLLRLLGPRKANVAVFVKSLSDPVYSEIDPLKSFILHQIENIMAVEINSAEKDQIIDPSQKYVMKIYKLSEPDIETESDGLGFNSSKDF
jgi:hypothetical protein